MDLLHDLLAFPGSVGLGINNQNNNGDEVPVQSAKNQDSKYSGVLSPLRSLLQPSLDTLSSIYRNGEPISAHKSGDYRVQVLKLRLAEVRILSGSIASLTDEYHRPGLIPNGSLPLLNWILSKERMPGSMRKHQTSMMSRLLPLD